MASVPNLVPPSKPCPTYDIQELRKDQPATVPERFIRDAEERPTFSTNLNPVEIPVIDLSKLVQGDEDQSCPEELAKLAAACEEWGFFQVVNHGIHLGLLQDIQRLAMEFFMLPLEEKIKYYMEPGTVQGYGRAFVFSEEQKLDWCNMFALGIEPSFIRKPNLWPTEPENFSKVIELYSAHIRKLCQQLLRYIAKGLGLERDTFNDMFGHSVQAVRMNYYPPCSRPDLVLGISPHSDGSAVTVLQQDVDAIGLQILKDNTWVSVMPIAGALVINIGDTIEVLTNGKYKSVEHRAVTNKEKDRLSIITFYAPSYDVELGPMPEFINEDRPCMYRRYNHGEYSLNYVTNKLDGKRSLEFTKIHPATN